MSAFFIYKNDKSIEYKSKYPEKKMKELTSLISKDWREETEEVKNIYLEKYSVIKNIYLNKIDELKKIHGDDFQIKNKKRNKRKKDKKQVIKTPAKNEEKTEGKTEGKTEEKVEENDKIIKEETPSPIEDIKLEINQNIDINLDKRESIENNITSELLNNNLKESQNDEINLDIEMNNSKDENLKLEAL